jgi:hypothetical protein
MNAKDQYKVIKAGFTIVRTMGDDPIINYKDKNNHEWKHYNSYPNKSQRDKALKKLLEDQFFIED